ncbi:hypothetical protein Tco_1541863 [Tanacetum coccineum]
MQRVGVAPKVLDFPESGDSTSIILDPPSFTPFEGSEMILEEEIEEFLKHDESLNMDLNDEFNDEEGDVTYLEILLEVLKMSFFTNHPLEFKKEIKNVESVKTSMEEPLELELKELPSHLEYAFLEKDNKLPVIISKDLKEDEKVKLIEVLRGGLDGWNALPAIHLAYYHHLDAKSGDRRLGVVGYELRDTWVSRSAYIIVVDLDSTAGRSTYKDRMTSRRQYGGGGGGLCFPRGLGHSIRLKSGSSDTATAIEYSHSDTISETLRVIRDMRREMSDMQAELLALREQQRRARQPGPEARIPDHQDASGDADSVVGLTRWIEKMESVFNISGCAIENQVKFATCTLLGASLTWWNGQIRTLGPEAYAMSWEVLKKKMTDKYCPQGEIKKLEIELLLLNEHAEVDKYISGLPDNIYGNVKSARPKTLDETIELANDLMDQKLRPGGKGNS